MRSIALSTILFAAACGGDNHTVEVSLGGAVNGLTGSGLVLAAGDEQIAVGANGAFTFASKLVEQTPYEVTIVSQPSGPTQHCQLTSAKGIAGIADIKNVSVRCTTTPFSVGGMIAGLAGSGLVLENNGEELAISATGAFEFTKPTPSGKPFAVTIKSQPSEPWQTCEVAGGTGTVVSGAVTSVVVNCDTDRFVVGGTVSGLAGTLRLQNGPDEVIVTSNGSYAFASTVASGQRYEVTVAEQPSTPSQTCVVTQADGFVADANIGGISVACTTNEFPVGGTVAGLDGSLVLQNNGGDDLAISQDGPFAFDTEIASGASYDVTVLSQPATQTCTVVNSGGDVGGSPIANVSVTCATNQYTVGGSVIGLSAGESVDVLNNGAGAIAMTADGTFTFAAPVAQGGTYAVTVANPPAGKTCDVTNGSGTITAPVTNVVVECASLLLDTAPTPEEFTDARCDGAISLAIQATQAVTVSRLDALLDPTTATQVRFAIFERDTSALVFYSTPVTVVPGSGVQTVRSPNFAFAMTAGTRYHFAAMVDGCAYFPWDSTPETANGLQTFVTNGNPMNFAAPTGPNECCGVDPAFKIYGTR